MDSAREALIGEVGTVTYRRVVMHSNIAWEQGVSMYLYIGTLNTKVPVRYHICTYT